MYQQRNNTSSNMVTQKGMTSLQKPNSVMEECDLNDRIQDGSLRKFNETQNKLRKAIQ